MTTDISRRDAVGTVFAGLLPAIFASRRQQQQGVPAEQGDISISSVGSARAAGMREPISEWDNDPRVIVVEKRLRCMCGCNQAIYQCRTTDFTCPLWPVTHPRIISMVQSGSTAEEIIASFMAESGEAVLMAPIPAGFNLTAYLLPGVMIAAIGSAMLWILGRRAQVMRAEIQESRSDNVPSRISSEEETVLKEELKKLDL